MLEKINYAEVYKLSQQLIYKPQIIRKHFPDHCY